MRVFGLRAGGGLIPGCMSCFSLPWRMLSSHLDNGASQKNRPQLFGSLRGTVYADFPPLVYHERYSAHPWPEKHSFPMSKFADLAELLASEQGPLGASGPIAMDGAFRPVDRPPHEWFEAVHDPEYYRAFLAGTLNEKAMRRIGLPHSDALVDRTLLEVSGTVLTARLALRHGLACNLAGGTHHAHRAFGSGYTILNDLAVASRVVQADGTAAKVTVVDCDVHQGDGTAAIFADDPSVRTISFHCEDNFPYNKQPSDIDVSFPAGAEDSDLLSALQQVLPSELKGHRPDLVLYDAGVDMHAGDRLGKMKISGKSFYPSETCRHPCAADEGLLNRDSYVIRTCLEEGVPVACVVGGGYDADRSVLAKRHATVFKAAFGVWRDLGDARATWR
ncbi:unnamed protein product [Ascophyllum nodosum]